MAEDTPSLTFNVLYVYMSLVLLGEMHLSYTFFRSDLLNMYYLYNSVII